MMINRYAQTAALFAAAMVFSAAAVEAQALGSFSWQLQPFCNYLTVTVTQQGSLYTLDGYDDQCGAPQRAPLVGTATLNPDGTIGFGVHIVTVPSGRAVDVEARISLGSLSGPWSDSLGHTGTFAFNARTGGLPRPVPTIPAAYLTPGSITAAQLAPGAVTTANVADGSITPQKLSVPLPRLVSSGLTTGTINLTLNTSVVVRSVSLTVPSAGQVMVNASGLFGFVTGSGFFIAGWCSITTGTAVETSDYLYARFVSPSSAQNLPFAGTRVFDVTAGVFTVNLACTALSDTSFPFVPVTIQTAGLTALFVPNY